MGHHVAIDSPELPEASQLWRMAEECGLDLNSPYHYLVWCRDFHATSAIARVHGEPAGFALGYRREENGALFIWQIGVRQRFRHEGLALAMLDHLWRRDPTTTVLEATVTPTNAASRRLFRAFADLVGAAWDEEVLFSASLFPEAHEDERLIRIGPTSPSPPGRIAGTPTGNPQAKRANPQHKREKEGAPRT